jgi:glycosyltransferase involved in cell wall biosynthesis
MEQPLINILIRTSNRPVAFAKCLESVMQQTYKNVNVIVGTDRASAIQYIPKHIKAVFVYADNNLPFFYDCYCNDLKSYANAGWFFFLDDDDILASQTALEELAQHLTEPGAIICQFLRNGLRKPNDRLMKAKIIREGHIGLPSLVLHSDYKHLSGLDGHKAGDYRYIKEVTDRVPTGFINIVLVNAGERGHGKMESNNHKFQNIQK